MLVLPIRNRSLYMLIFNNKIGQSVKVKTEYVGSHAKDISSSERKE